MPVSGDMNSGGRARLTPPQLALLLGGPIAVALASWVYLGIMIDDMSTIPGMSSMMMNPQTFDLLRSAGLFLMWAVMMAAMMLPTAVPMLMAYARMRSTETRRGAVWLSVSYFAGGYVLAWSTFSLAAAGIQLALTSAAVLSPMMMKVMPGPVAAGVLIFVGAYQFTPLKQSCLRQCRTPIAFLMTQWRNGDFGALMMGWRHGLFCVGCCWALMALLLVAGVMNTVWIIVITLYVLIEKVVPNSQAISRLVGAGLIGLGLWTLAT